MNRLFNVFFMLILFEVGVLLVVLPWVGLWERQYFVFQYPMLRPFLLHPAVRGVISGLGALDILIAAGMVRRRPLAAPTPSASRNAT